MASGMIVSVAEELPGGTTYICKTKGSHIPSLTVRQLTVHSHEVSHGYPV